MWMPSDWSTKSEQNDNDLAEIGSDLSGFCSHQGTAQFKTSYGREEWGMTMFREAFPMPLQHSNWNLRKPRHSMKDLSNQKQSTCWWMQILVSQGFSEEKNTLKNWRTIIPILKIFKSWAWKEHTAQTSTGRCHVWFVFIFHTVLQLSHNEIMYLLKAHWFYLPFWQVGIQCYLPPCRIVFAYNLLWNIIYFDL